MTKTNLPVLILRGVVLLPNNDIRLEFDNDESQNIIDLSMMFHDNLILVITHENATQEVLPIDELPAIGVVSKIIHKIELPDGKIRVLIRGIKRSLISEYLNTEEPGEMLESIVQNSEEAKIPNEELVVKKIYREVEYLTKTIPYISNAGLSLIINITDSSKLIDTIIPYIPSANERVLEYLKTMDLNKRIDMLLEDIYKEKDLFEVEKNIETKVKKSIDSTQKEFLLREKAKIIKEELGEISPKDEEIENLKEKINNLDASKNIINRLKKELKRYEALPSTSPELNNIRNYIDWLLELPWKKETKDNKDLNKVKEKLDSTHYGLDKIKERIIEFLAVKQNSNRIKSPILCLVGPPGVGKTSLAFSIAEAVKRNFVKISVGGISDEAEIKGHRKTYVGSNPGRIIQSMKKAKSTNPVFLIDEIDKMSKDYKGDPASALLEVLDPEQNQLFSDHYIEEEYDLSKVMFITTANYIQDIPEALLDRMEIIRLSSYTEYEKLDIVKTHLFKKVCLEHNIDDKKLIIKDDVILDIIRYYTKEAGVRDLERQLAKIIRKIVTKLVINKIKMNKIIVSKKDLENYLGKKKYRFQKDLKSVVGLVNGLAYTQYGGDVLPIEVSIFDGNGGLVLTGSLGKVMKESAQIALSYIKSNLTKFKIKKEKLFEKDIHIHVPEGAIPKDGPSAGIALTTALISFLTNKKIPSDIAMTGEITLNGDVLPIGGLKEKSLGAYRSGVKRIFIPIDNIKDLDEIPKEVTENIKYIPVSKYAEIFKELSDENENK